MSKITPNIRQVSRLAGLTISLLWLSACVTTQPEAPNEAPISITPPPMNSCTPISALERIVIPAKVETFYAVTQIDNPPYEPITRKEKMTREVEPRQVFYVDSEGREVTDLCDAPASE